LQGRTRARSVPPQRWQWLLAATLKAGLPFGTARCSPMA
jgi:hypothetical protein